MNETVVRVLTYIAARLKEPSTYVALTLVSTGLGHWAATSEATRGQILMDIGLFVAGLIGAALPDRLGQNTRANDPQEKKQ